MSLSTLFETQVKIGISDSDFKKGIATAGALVADFASSGVKALGSLTGSFASLTKDVASSVKELAVYGDHIDKQSQKMNMSAKAYQEWDAIMQHSGTTIDSMQMSMKTLANAADSENEAFARLGFSMEDVHSMSSEELFSATITALQNVENQTERTAIASDLLGRGATELGALLNTSAEDTEKMRQRVHELGGVMSDDAVKASAAFQDSLQDMQTAISGLKRSFAAELLPSFKEVMDGITEVFAGEEGGENKIERGITQAFNGISRAATKLKPVISRLGNSLFNVIQSNIPQIIRRSIQFTTEIATEVIRSIPQILNDAGGIMSTIGETLTENIPQLAGAAKLAITSFAGYLRDNLPTLIPEGVNAVVEFTKGITDPENSKALIDAAFDVVDGLLDGLTSEKTIDAIIDGAPVIVDNLVTGIVNVADRLGDAALTLSDNLIKYFADEKNREKLKQCAEKILDGIASGILSLLGTGAEAVYNFGGQIAENIGLGDYWQCGNDAMKEFAEGFKEKFDKFKEWWNFEWSDLVNPTSVFDSAAKSASAAAADLFGTDTDSTDTASTQVHHRGFSFELGTAATTAATIGLATLNSNRYDVVSPAARYTTINISHSGTLNDDADFDRLAEKIDNVLANRYIGQERAIGGTGY